MLYRLFWFVFWVAMLGHGQAVRAQLLEVDYYTDYRTLDAEDNPWVHRAPSYSGKTLIKLHYQCVQACLEGRDCPFELLDEAAFAKAQKRYLRRQKQDPTVLEQLTQVDYFYREGLRDRLAERYLNDAQRLLNAEPTTGKALPLKLVDALKFSDRRLAELAAYRDVRADEVQAMRQQVADARQRLTHYAASSAYDDYLARERTIAAAVLYDPALEEMAKGLLLKNNPQATVHRTHIVEPWTDHYKFHEEVNYRRTAVQMTVQDAYGNCHLYQYNIEKQHLGSGHYDAATVYHTQHWTMSCDNTQ